MEVEGESDRAEEFAQFSRAVGERVRRALVSFYGVEVGTVAWRHALAVAERRWHDVSIMANPAGYLFREGHVEARRRARVTRARNSFPSTDRLQAAYDASMVELFESLSLVKQRQRAALLLVTGFGYSVRETAAVLELDESAVVDHVRRGLQRLRSRVEVEMLLEERLRSAGEVLVRLSVEHEQGSAPVHPGAALKVSSSRPLLWLAVAVAAMVVAVILTLVIPHRRPENGPATTTPRPVATAPAAGSSAGSSGGG